MKLFIASAALLLGSSLQAQETILDTVQLQKRALQYQMQGGNELQEGPNGVLKFRIQGNDSLTKEKLRELVITLPGNKVIQLPQDHMPCIVPDTRDIAIMPNPGAVKNKAPEPGKIPNAWKNGPVIPEKLSK